VLGRDCCCAAVDAVWASAAVFSKSHVSISHVHSVRRLFGVRRVCECANGVE